MSRRRKMRAPRWDSRALLLVGAALATVSLFLPWFDVDRSNTSLFEDFLGQIGLLPDLEGPVRGYQIPLVVRDELGGPLLQTGHAFDDLGRGRVDRFAARLVFGERYEEELAPLVLLPALLALISLLVLRFPAATLLASWLSLVDLAAVIAGTVFWRNLAQDASLPLVIRAGLPLTLLGLLLAALGAARATARSPARRRKRVAS